MNTTTITLIDAVADDGKRGVIITRKNSERVISIGGELAPTVAQILGVILVEKSRKFCDEIGMTVEVHHGIGEGV